METPEIPMKRCTKCGREFPAITEFWHKDKNSKYGLCSICKLCISERQRRYYEENREKEIERQRRYYEENREKIAEYKHHYREENREKLVEYFRRYREENREKLIEHSRRYYKEQPKKAREYNRHYREENRETIAEYQRRYREENRETISVRARRYREEHPELSLAQNHRRRARKRSLPTNWTADLMTHALSYWQGHCAYCGNPLADLFGEVMPHFDHYIPISYDSDDNPGTVPENMLPVCSSCNLSKNATMPEEWIYRTFGKRRGKKIIQAIQDYFEYIRGLRQDE